jgi:putative transposase
VKVCQALAVPRSTFYQSNERADDRPSQSEQKLSKPSFRALTDAEIVVALELLHSEEFVDLSPASIVAKLLDQGRYVCSERTIYRLLHKHSEVKERRNVVRHCSYKKPELMAVAPKELFTWDITKLKGPKRGEMYNLYVMLDVYSRYVVGWLLDEHEDQNLASSFMKTVCRRHCIQPNQLIIHADNGPAMRSSLVKATLAEMHVRQSHSRPHCSNDNPFIESHFKTMKYCNKFPTRFSSIDDARAFCEEFFPCYNNQMYHSGIEMLTPATVYFGKATEVIANRQCVLNTAFSTKPERFVKGCSKHKTLPPAVYINKPVAAKNVILN